MSTFVTNVSAANTALTLTLPATANIRWALAGYSVSVRGAATGADLSITVNDNGTVVWRDTIGNAAARGTRITQDFPRPIVAAVANTAMTLVIPAGGTGVFIAASLYGHEIPAV